MTLTLDATRPRPTARRPARLLLPFLFSATAFTGAAMLFLVEPLVAKLLLPSYGGAATVWATSTLFFQVVLLGAYLLVHQTSRLGPRRQPAAQLPLALVALLVLPLALPSDAAPDGGSPVLWLLRTLALMVGLPFAVLATTGPLLQRWYSWTDAPRAHDPYFLYAASNVGSFVGLLAYPFLVEPWLSLTAQRTAWSWAFGAFVLLVALCGIVVMRSPQREEVATEIPRHSVAAVPRSRVLRWIALAFVPSSLMLGVTTHISTDVASIPLLWVVPLAIYLATMVAAFAGDRRRPPVTATQVAVLAAMVALVGTFSAARLGVVFAMAVGLVMLAVVGYAAHAQLAADRPDVSQLTKFYVAVSVGGALGGLVNGLLAPSFLDRPLEYPLVLALVPLLLAFAGGSRLIAGTLVALQLFLLFAVQQMADPAVMRSRTFYGSYIVREQPEFRTLNHGTTLHGLQFLDERADEPTSYFARSGPLGDIFAAEAGVTDVAVVGLGAGTIAAYGQQGQRMTFVEIDPEVIRIARDETLFTFLRDSKAELRTIAGDGRLELAAMPRASLDLLILDAFSSDAIPVHLLTREALAVYASRLRPGGVIAVHISNRVFNLEPVLADSARSLGWRAVSRLGGGGTAGTRASHWVVLTSGETAGTLLAKPGWHPVPTSRTVHWTDDYSSVVAVLK